MHNDFNGVINATDFNGLEIQGSGGVTNDGLIEASGGGNLFLTAVDVTNTAGIVQANSGSSVVLGDAVTIAGGTLSTNGTGVIRSGSSALSGARTRRRQEWCDHEPRDDRD